MEWIDEQHYLDLAACSPDNVVQRTGCQYDSSLKKYTLAVWGHQYCVDLNARKILPVTDAPRPYQEFLYLFIVFYLIQARNIYPTRQWVSEKDIPGGAAFFRGPHTIPTHLITQKAANDPDRFKQTALSLGGQPLDMADAAFYFEITPQIPVAVLFWQGDEDFPAEARLLFDKNINAHLPLDIIFALAVEVCHAFTRE